jgi:hypothetical protein
LPVRDFGTVVVLACTPYAVLLKDSSAKAQTQQSELKIAQHSTGLSFPSWNWSLFFGAPLNEDWIANLYT